MTSARVAPQVEVRSRQSCPLCQDCITALPHLVACPDCQAIHHRDCVAEMGHCGTMHCGGLRELAAEARRDSRVGAAAASDDHDGLDEPSWRQLEQADQEVSRFLGAVSYVANLAGAMFILPGLIYWQSDKKGDEYSQHHAQQALLLSVCTLFTFGLFVPFMVVFSVVGAIKAYRGEWWAPPVLRRFASDTAKTEWAKQVLQKPDPKGHRRFRRGWK